MDWKNTLVGAGFVALALATLGYNILGSWSKWVIGLGLMAYGVTKLGYWK